ncbi:serine hydrolase [Rhodococcus sp. HNM0569]|nr:serine hydrolase [Rhodococcus sp. HNM0569]
MVFALVAGVAVASCTLPVTPDAADGASPTPSTTSAPLAERVAAADAYARARRADVSIALLDRATDGAVEVSGSSIDVPVPCASIVKVFLAAQLLHLDATGERPLSADDDATLSAMLESSDDGAAGTYWTELGPDAVREVADRYELAHTTPASGASWWNTESTAGDLVRFYRGVLDDVDGLGAARIDRFVDLLEGWAETANDGYDQEFGIAAVLTSAPRHHPDARAVAVKQGWMCCISGRWIHWSTGIVGHDEDGRPGRYVIAVASTEDVQYPDGDDLMWFPDTSYTDASEDDSARHARETVTGVVSTVFPGGADEWNR